jgi:FtsP/CotA-like multicopper oxidase with cupredoxin domain
MKKHISLLSCLIGIGLVAAHIQGCDAPPADETPKDKPMPKVEGLQALEDEDPDPNVVEYKLDIGAHNMALYEGATPANVFAYNGILPGPMLQARLGDTVRVVATNNLDEPTTIHWHGLRIDYKMDGVALDGLPTIQPGETFTYEFTPPDAGTYWYHPHMRTTVQLERGLYGMLIVHEPEAEQPDVDADRAFIFDDIRLNDDGTIAQFATSGPDIVHGRAGNVLLVNGQTEVINLDLAPGQVERWRLVNTASAREMRYQFPGLEVREIGADGGLWPQEDTRIVEEILLPVGARAELEVRLAPGSTGGTLNSMIPTVNAANQVVLSAFPMVEVAVDDSVSVDSPKAGHTADVKGPVFTARPDIDNDFELAAFNRNGRVVMTINNETFEENTPWVVNKGELKVMRIINMMPQNGHPFHLHGQFFQILERDGQPTDEPGWRDTVWLPAGGGRSVTIATYFDNPGRWIYHCHILEHAEAGMMAMLNVVPFDE